VAPVEKGERTSSTLDDVDLVVFVAGAVAHRVAVDQGVVLGEHCAPGVVHERLRRLDPQAAVEQPRGDGGGALRTA
jgi:hypothetical protein